MKINLTYNGSEYQIIVEQSSFTAAKLGTNQTKGENFGKPTQSIIGHCSLLSTAIKRIVQNEMSESKEEISLNEYCTRIETAYKELVKQTDL